MISIVIPAYNEEKYIGVVLEALTTQPTRLPFEVIVVNNASTDATAAVALGFVDKLHLRVIDEPKKGRGAARAAGFAAAGDIILSTDADATPPPRWVEQMHGALEKSGGVAVSGTCYINDLSWLENTIFNFIQPAAMVAHRMVFGHWWLTGSNFAMYKNAYLQAGGFKNLNSQEDTELGERVRKLGKIMFVRHVPVLVSGRRFQDGLVRGLWDYVRSFGERWLLRKKEIILSDAR